MQLTKGKPVPPVTRKAPMRKYPFDEMDVGDSLEFEDVDTFERARRALWTFKKNHGGVFTSRRGYQGKDHTGIGGTIWRVE